ncbi:MAG: YceI family protein [SAR324 cluster bacterium]|nr:YceI family protein [SAR324 cluster bacterium]
MTQNYRISKDSSQIRLLLYKEATLLSPLAHNHVMVITDLDGMIRYDAQNIGKSGFSVTVPVSTFNVDSEQFRREEGPDFASKISDRDIKKTTEIMLDKDILYARKFPTMSLDSLSVSGQLPQLSVKTSICIKGNVCEVMLPVHVDIEANQMKIAGEIMLKQTDFKIKPVSVLLGSIKLQNEFQVKFNIVAELE